MKPTNEQVKLASDMKQVVLTLWDAIAELLVAHDKEVRERAIEDAALLADADSYTIGSKIRALKGSK